MVISRQTDRAPVFPDLSLPSSYLKLFLDKLLPRAEQQSQLFGAAGLGPDCLERNRIPLDEVVALIDAMDRSLPAAWHVAPCLSLEPAQHGPVGLAAISAATITDALSIIERFERIRAPWSEARLYRESSSQVLEVSLRHDLPQHAAILMEMNLLALAGLTAQLLGARQSALCLEITGQAAARDEALRRAWPGHIETGAPRLAIRIPCQHLNQACLLADSELHELMVHRCQRLLRDPLEHRVSVRVLDFLARQSGRNPGLCHTARALGLSERSLSRHLAAENSSYRALVDQSRLKIATEMLIHSSIPIADIAEHLGYADPANFNRAFRRWTGQSPGRLRNRSQNKG